MTELRPCQVQGCERIHYGKGYCRLHYRRWQNNGDPLIVKQGGRKAGPRKICAVPDCEKPVRALGLCSSHEQRMVKYGDPLFPLQRRPQGTGSMFRGYVYLRGRGLHREVMEQILGRQLRSFENVHHVNGIRSDNRPENLELWTKPQPVGQRPEDLVAWVKEFYGHLL